MLACGLGVVAQIGPATAIGGLCEGRPASHSWPDASGQQGPALLEGTRGDDVIVGGSGDDTLQHGGMGALVKLSGDDGYDRCIFRAGDELISCEL